MCLVVVVLLKTGVSHHSNLEVNQMAEVTIKSGREGRRGAVNVEVS